MVDDTDRDVRVVVYRALARRPFRGALSALQGAITVKDLEKKGQREKRALFQAFGAVAGTDGVAMLAPLLRGKNPSGQRPSSHTRACAATALGVIATPDARAALDRAARDRDPVVRSAVSAALRGDR
jgi:HEAT repeat protein